MFGYYVQQPSLWHDVSRTLRRPINYCIYLWRRLRVQSRERVSFICVWTSSVYEPRRSKIGSYKEIVGECKYILYINSTILLQERHLFTKGYLRVWNKDLCSVYTSINKVKLRNFVDCIHVYVKVWNCLPVGFFQFKHFLYQQCPSAFNARLFIHNLLRRAQVCHDIYQV